MKLSICTQLLDWNFGLREALPTWFKLDYHEILIFDFDCCHEHAKDVVSLYPGHNITLLTPVNSTPYNNSVGRNTTISACSGDIIFYLDADVKVKENFKPQLLHPLYFLQGCRYKGPPIVPSSDQSYPKVCNNYMGMKDLYETSLIGSCVFWKNSFLQINGFDERMQGWGYNDYEFFMRLMKLGVNRSDFPDRSLEHVDHTVAKRVQNFDIKNIWTSEKLNRGVATNPWGPSFKRVEIPTKVYCP